MKIIKGQMIEWMGRQTAIGAPKKRYVGKTQSERDLLKQFIPERKQGGAEIRQEDVETAVATSQVIPDKSSEDIDELYTAEVNEIGNDSEDEEENAYEREINRIQHFEEVILPGLITVISTIIFFFAFTIILSPHAQ